MWKDSLWDLFRYGYCHTSCKNSCCCSLLAAGQVISRLGLTCWGSPGPVTVGAFKRLVYLACAFWTTRILLLLIIAVLDPNIESTEWIEPPTSYYFFAALDDLLAYMYLGFTVVVLRNLRAHVRSKYAIPEGNACPTGCEDTCCSIFCPCAVAAQMLRHTADYNAYPALCCSDTGLPANAPSIV
jgi:Cys-rich protein (TIGR01571 family)